MSGPTYCDMCGRWPATRYNNGTRCCICDDLRWAKHHPVPGSAVEPSCPTDKAFIFSPRKPDETDAEWAKRCCVIKNIGKSE